MWKKYQARLARKGEEVSKVESFKIRYQNTGLATYIYASCTRRTRWFMGHKWYIQPHISGAAKGNQFDDNKRYALNMSSILAAHCLIILHCDMKRTFAFLGIPYISNDLFKAVEKIVGSTLEKFSQVEIEKALEEEKSKSIETYHTKLYGMLPSLTVGTDMMWNKQALGRLYNSPSDVMYTVGCLTSKVISIELYKNVCNDCNMQENALGKKDESIKNGNKDDEKKWEKKASKYNNIQNLKNYSGTSKSMESDAIMNLALSAPTKLKAYIRRIILDDDTSTRAHLREDKGITRKVCLPKSLTGITILADPMHRKQTICGQFYALTKKGKKECALQNNQAGKLAEYFGYWCS